MKYLSLALVAAIPLLVSACTPKPADTQGDDGSSSGDASTGDTGGAEETSATNPTTSATEDGATEGTTTGSPGTGMTATTETVTSADPTVTTEPDPTEQPPPDGPLLAACTDLCDALLACMLVPPGPECVEGCAGDEEPGSECAKLAADEWSCVAKLTCEQLEEFVQGTPMVCLDEVEAYDEGCAQTSDCSMFAGSGGEGECSVGQTCGDVSQEYRCVADTCTCIENEVPGKECPSDNLCGGDEPNFDELEMAAQGCCGWDWS